MYIWWCCWWGGGGIVCVSRWICLYTYCHWHHRNWAKARGFWGGHWFVNLGSRRWRWNTEPSSSMERAAKIMRFLRELFLETQKTHQKGSLKQKEYWHDLTCYNEPSFFRRIVWVCWFLRMLGQLPMLDNLADGCTNKDCADGRAFTFCCFGEGSSCKLDVARHSQSWAPPIDFGFLIVAVTSAKENLG